MITDSHLASFEEIARWTEPTETGGATFQFGAVRAKEGERSGRGHLSIPPGTRERHILTIGEPGFMRRKYFLYTLLYQYCVSSLSSEVVFGLTKEEVDAFAWLTESFNPDKKVVIYDPFSEGGLRWNVFAKLGTRSDAALTAYHLYDASKGFAATDLHYKMRGKICKLLEAMLLAGLGAGSARKLSPASLCSLAKLEPSALCEALQTFPESKAASREFASLVADNPIEAEVALSEVRQRLRFWDLTTIRASTSEEGLDLDNLIDGPTIFLVPAAGETRGFSRVLNTVFLQEILRHFTVRAESAQAARTSVRPVTFVIENIAESMPALSQFQFKLLIASRFGAQFVVTAKSLGELECVAEDSLEILTSRFGYKLLLPPVELEGLEVLGERTAGALSFSATLADESARERYSAAIWPETDPFFVKLSPYSDLPEAAERLRSAGLF